MNFLGKHYILFIIITLVLIFALIGYFVEKKQNKESPFKIASEKRKTEDLNLENIQVNNDMALSEMINKNASIKQEGTPEDINTNNQV